MLDKKIIYVDLTNLLQVDFVSGIQRVVIQIMKRLLHEKEFCVKLLFYEPSQRSYNVLDNEAWLDFYERGKGEKEYCKTTQYISLNSFKSGSVFFDIDSVWQSTIPRSILYPDLKNQGIIIYTMVYDIIPITHARYCDKDTCLRFNTYLGATLMYSDRIVTNTNATVEQIQQVCDKLDVTCPSCSVLPLGSDFAVEDSGDPSNVDVASIANLGPYVLMVGTIEPRKNHELLVRSLDVGMKANVVFAGRVGWNIREFIDRVEKHPQYNKRIFLITDANDAAIHDLYQSAYYVAMPTFNEGFGLPLIESFREEVPVVAADIPVLREVGGEFADYIDNRDANSFASFINASLENPEIYRNRKDNLKNYDPLSWEACGEQMCAILKKR